ncbi:MAG: hypothetical protein IAE79_27980, partial [Anaerolinea sp.]|nr:hypothetical protein [Anaerolinea sp.]
WHSSANAYLVVWQRDGNVWARPFLSTGSPLNPAFAVSTASGAAPATQPAVAPIPGASTFLVVWNQSGFDGDGRILGRAVMTAGPQDASFPIAEEPLAARGAPTLAAAGEGTHLLAWEDSRGGHLDVYASLVRQEVVVNTSIAYTYDPLYRLVNAAYSGILNGNYGYEYDTAGNRLQFQTNL